MFWKATLSIIMVTPAYENVSVLFNPFYLGSVLPSFFTFSLRRVDLFLLFWFSTMRSQQLKKSHTDDSILNLIFRVKKHFLKAMNVILKGYLVSHVILFLFPDSSRWVPVSHQTWEHCVACLSPSGQAFRLVNQQKGASLSPTLTFLT